RTWTARGGRGGPPAATARGQAIMRGRGPAGPEDVEKLQGPADAKRRLGVVPRALAGAGRVPGDREAPGGGGERVPHPGQEGRAAREGRTPRPPGRPAAPPADPRVAALERQQEALRLELLAAQTREEIALVLPRLAQAGETAPGDAAGKKARRRRQGGRRP